MTEEKLEFTRRLLVLGNLGVLGMDFSIVLRSLFYNQIYGWFYLLLEALIVYAILRRLGCSSCYKCKTCTSGFGRIAGAFFGKGYVKKESVGNRLGLRSFCLFFAVSGSSRNSVFLAFAGFSFLKVLVLVCLFAVAVYSLTTWYKRSTVSS